MACARHTAAHQAGCEDCRAHARRYWRKRRAAIAAGTWLPPVDADVVRAHVLALVDAGMTRRDIARTAYVSEAVLTDLLVTSGPRRRRTIRGDIAAALAAVRPVRSIPAGLADATVARRKVRALAWLGYGVETQARELGVGYRNLWQLANDRPDGTPRTTYVTPATAAAVDALFARWSTARCPDRLSNARTNALKKGWPGPIVWADIDDPQCVPDVDVDAPRPARDDLSWSSVDDALAGAVAHEALTTAERVAAVTILAARGWSDLRIGEWLSWPHSPRDHAHQHSPVWRFRKHHGIPSAPARTRDAAAAAVRQALQMASC